MTPEIGKRYRTKGGKGTSALELLDRSDRPLFVGFVGGETTQRVWRFDGTHEFGANRLDLVAEWTEGPVREVTVTRKEIVSGNWNRVEITATEGRTQRGQVGIRFFSMLATAPELRAAAATLIELADALEGE